MSWKTERTGCKKIREEKFSKNIAKKIIEARKNKPIETTLELVDIISSSVPTKYFVTKHPERQIFQAIRIEVNSELNVLNEVLPDAINLFLNLSIISLFSTLSNTKFDELKSKLVFEQS